MPNVEFGSREDRIFVGVQELMFPDANAFSGRSFGNAN
jgi:hypothetical protein